jgi:hypothetical protein
MMTDEQLQHITMFMRVASFLKNHHHEIEEHQEMVDAVHRFMKSFEQVMKFVSEEEMDLLLERYQVEIEYLREQYPSFLKKDSKEL